MTFQAVAVDIRTSSQSGTSMYRFIVCGLSEINKLLMLLQELYKLLFIIVGKMFDKVEDVHAGVLVLLE